jgi:alkylhydroperoxidase/carboxymuconolactone decarboxylase family protein YurZ
VLVLNAALAIAAAGNASSSLAQSGQTKPLKEATVPNEQLLTARQQAIAPIAAFAAAGDMGGLDAALNKGLSAGLSIGEAREILVQLYAYAGFPRSLNALGQLMKVAEARRKQGIQDAPGREPGHAIPTGEALLAAGTANQTKLVGAPVKGPLFDFAPAIDHYLKTHLFGDIFERDNLDWQSRELATVGMLAALSGAESQLQSHIRISLNTGLSVAQLHQVAGALREQGNPAAGARVEVALQNVTSTDG